MGRKALTASSVDIAALAARAREQEKEEKEGSGERFAVRLGGRDAMLLRLYAVALSEKRVVAHVSSKTLATSLVAGLKLLRVRARAVRAATSSSSLGAEDVLIVCDDALAVKKRQLERWVQHDTTIVYVDRGNDKKREALHEKKKILELFDDSKAPRWKNKFPEDVLGARCGVALGFLDLLEKDDAAKCRAAKTKLEVLLNCQTMDVRGTKRKMALLGMVQDDLPKGFRFGIHATCDGSYREVARTRYLDHQGPPKKLRSPAWLGNERTGAAADNVTRQIARALQEDPNLAPGWRPNTETAVDTPTEKLLGDWGPSPFGKVAAHNEVCMHCSRPFVPLEVVNTRLCSRARPAPGNDGFDGCREFLITRAQKRRHPCTVWDTAEFFFVDANGLVDSLPKSELLAWPLPTLNFVVPLLRDWTLLSKGTIPPRTIVSLIFTILAFASNDRRLIFQQRALPSRGSHLVLTFILGGDRATWRSLPTVTN